MAAAIKALAPLERPAEPHAAAEPVKPPPQHLEAADRPVQPTLVPAAEVLDAAPEPLPRQASAGLRMAAWTTTGLAVAAAGTAVAFGVMGLGPRSAVTGATNGALTYGRAQELSAQANTNFSVALGAGIGAAALGVLSGVLWSQVQ